MLSTPDIRYDRILFCTDFSLNADFAFHFALKSAERSVTATATLHILHVIPEPEAQFWQTYLYEVDGVDGKAQEDMSQKIRDSYMDLVPENIIALTAVRQGRAHEAILHYAEEIDANLIVLGRQGFRGLGKAFFGNVTEKIVLNAKCPVLVIPYPHKEPGKKEFQPQ